MSIDDGIRAFWDWWATARDRVVSAIEVERNFSEDLVADIGAHVDAIQDGMSWELCPGATARHAFCLSPNGDAEVRLVTEVWRQRGPAPDEVWEYHAARQRRDGGSIEMEGVDIDRDDFVVSYEVDENRERIDATYFHPRFADLPEERHSTVLFLLLDSALGEDGVERWLGTIEPATEAPEGAVPFEQFLAAVAELERTATGNSFSLLQGETDEGAPLFVTCNMALKRIDHLLHTVHVAVDLAILDQNPQGLTTQADADVLNALEDELSAELGTHAVYFGRETTPGHRLMHWFTPDDSPAERIIAAWSHRHPERRPQVAVTRDPTWEFTKRYC